MKKEAAEHFMFGLKNYHWKQKPELTKHAQYVLDTIYDDFKNELKAKNKYIKELEDKIYDMQNMF